LSRLAHSEDLQHFLCVSGDRLLAIEIAAAFCQASTGIAQLLLLSWTESLGPRARIRGHRYVQIKASELQLCRAAYRNRTDDLRITRRIRAVHGCPDGHTYPARAASCSARVRGSPGPLLANPLAQPIPGRLRLLPILAAPRRVGPAGAARPARARSRQCGAEPHHSP
jgi:hypothetical protein